MDNTQQLPAKVLEEISNKAESLFPLPNIKADVEAQRRCDEVMMGKRRVYMFAATEYAAKLQPLAKCLISALDAQLKIVSDMNEAMPDMQIELPLWAKYAIEILQGMGYKEKNCCGQFFYGNKCRECRKEVEHA